MITYLNSASRTALSLLTVAAAALAPILPAQAYEVTPMIYDLKPAGAEAATILRVHNDADKPLTVEMVVEKRSFDEHGKETRTPAEDDFVLFPPQALIPPNRTQAIRVQYVGAANLSASTTYLVTVKQVPVNLPSTEKSGIQMVFNFSTMASVVPIGATPRIEVAAAQPAGDGVDVRIRNAGSKYANLSQSKLSVAGTVYEGPDLGKLVGSVWLFPGGERAFHVKVPADGNRQDVQFTYVPLGN